MGEYADDIIDNFIDGSWGFRHRRQMSRSFKAEKGSELARLRIDAHKNLDAHWHFGAMTRSEVYQRLARDMNLPASECHIGMFDEAQCRRVIEICASWVG